MYQIAREAVVENSRGITEVCKKLMKLHQEVQIGIQILYKYSRPSFESAVNSSRLISSFGFASQERGLDATKFAQFVLLFPLPLKQDDFDRSIAEYGVRYCIAFNECALDLRVS
ncbi:hypothetical protein FRACYDRAFT_247859 [Fragilariopsis cylindrus CCMP1102]|uniref:Uncharacterized protein n=1 Tax=Fragilariopsis cylindrus CCMP1102 TaxID=635003 RepID=A0A1E7EWR0_9STRA|nr:hypothetical protein FRACYDRAFT_247859 [Fragilariopsis cylindrus CCMP1102]|eukprot:OEU10244.1 hypothetical protein FRACYDRAFT_247859 [Fragilariopsis cylindrus CCMP1102]